MKRDRKVWKPSGKQEAPKLLYLTYFVNFPNGAQWIKQEPIVHGIEYKLNELRKEHANDFDWMHRFYDLQHKHEMWWKDSHNIEHHFIIETKKRPQEWGGKTKHGNVQSGLIL